MNLPAPARVLSPTPRRTRPPSLGASSAMVPASTNLRVQWVGGQEQGAGRGVGTSLGLS